MKSLSQGPRQNPRLGCTAGVNADAGLAPTEVREAALYANLKAGSYTVVLRGFENSTGIGLVEVYDLTPAP